jgi:hypothetical protein
VIFTALQGYEYYEAGFTIADGVYGSTFFMATGLYGIGPINFTYHKYTTGYKSGVPAEISPHWITGFSDAEASFIIKIGIRKMRKTPWNIIPVFTIELSGRDLALLQQIQTFFGVGNIYSRVRDGRTMVVYSVQSLKDIVDKIIPHFKNFPLLTQKQADFQLFSMIVDLIINKEHLTPEGISKIIAIRSSMNKGLSDSLKLSFPNIIPIERPIITKIQRIFKTLFG